MTPIFHTANVINATVIPVATTISKNNVKRLCSNIEGSQNPMKVIINRARHPLCINFIHVPIGMKSTKLTKANHHITKPTYHPAILEYNPLK
jgi:hypothetical protein